uniref:Uncharacterized protein AlNc14C189G8410 n=1 Tax=Albugo laibachii Nc14 TaxID=890382 RepID=F0WPR8_9STRA|nr:conserved hypothetical protein [Albugo laibachii Nc14]CCA24345.1 conserved hypothetical protein [Albugo laibachii Nc14]|eukprot:CCA24345.1 conserved hypothetical protein [Albugo laibachii Nc14]
MKTLSHVPHVDAIYFSSHSWRVFRDQKSEKSTTLEIGSKVLPNWAQDGDEEDSDDWSVEEKCDKAVSLNDLEMLLDACHVEATPPTRVELEKKASQIPSDRFPSFLLEVIEEPFESREDDFSHEKELYENYINSQSESSIQGSDAKTLHSEVYEATPTEKRHFMRFQERIKRCPQQCLRYDYDGEPLWPTPIPSSFEITKCKCGRERKFECQLMPTILYVMGVDKNGRSGMDWLSLLVYSCPESCDKSREEVIHIVRNIKSIGLSAT